MSSPTTFKYAQGQKTKVHMKSTEQSLATCSIGKKLVRQNLYPGSNNELADSESGAELLVRYDRIAEGWNVGIGDSHCERD